MCEWQCGWVLASHSYSSVRRDPREDLLRVSWWLAASCLDAGYGCCPGLPCSLSLRGKYSGCLSFLICSLKVTSPPGGLLSPRHAGQGHRGGLQEGTTAGTLCCGVRGRQASRGRVECGLQQSLGEKAGNGSLAGFLERCGLKEMSQAWVWSQRRI